MLTLPTTDKGTAKVVPSKGVKINYIFYWNDGFRDPAIEKTQIPVRYDPFDAGYMFAFIHSQWCRCISSHQWVLNNRSERELMLASSELRRRNQMHGKRFNLTALKLAEFLLDVDVQEQSLLHLQRKRDAEIRRLLSRVERTSLQLAAPKESDEQDHPPPAASLSASHAVSKQSELSYSLSDGADDIDLSSLESYGKY